MNTYTTVVQVAEPCVTAWGCPITGIIWETVNNGDVYYGEAVADADTIGAYVNPHANYFPIMTRDVYPKVSGSSIVSPLNWGQDR